MNRRTLLKTGPTAALISARPRMFLAHTASAAQDGWLPELTITVNDAGFEVPREPSAGRYTVSVENTSSAPFHAALGRLPTGATLDEIYAFLTMESEEIPEWFTQIGFVGLPDWTEPGERRTGIIDLQMGDYFMFDPFSTDSTTLTVTGEGDFSVEPESDLTVEMREMEFLLPAGDLTIGPARVKVMNSGAIPHEFHLLAVPEGTTVEHFLEIFALPENATPPPDNPLSPLLNEYAPVAATSMLGSGLTSWIDIDLTPGAYALMCALPFPSGTPHAMEGMIEVITLAPAAA